MTRDEVIETFPLDEYGDIYLDLFDVSMIVDDFIAFFDGAELSYESLVNHPKATEAWKQQFYHWYEQGILN